MATEVDVAQAQTQLETMRAQLVDVGVARAQYEHAIGTIADYKLPDFSIPFSPLDLDLPKIPLGVPSQLLERRPDIAAAERRTAAANAQIGIAVSAFYPTISLGGTGGFESTHVGTWIQGPSALWSLGAQATELLFDAGQRRALTDQAKHTTRRRFRTTRASSFWPSKMWRISFRACGFWSRSRPSEQQSRGFGAALLRCVEPALQGRRDQLS